MNAKKTHIIDRILSATKCERCCIPVGYPGVSFSRDGDKYLCEECQRLLNNEPDRASIKQEALHIIDSIKNSGEFYDAIFAYSGGRDSTTALYSVVKEYGLRVLVFNYDNGFKGRQVKNNIHSVISDLGTDFYQIKSTTSHTIAEDIANNILPCGRCSALKHLYPRIASLFNVKYIITGIECLFNNEAIRNRGSFFQINWPAALNWSKDEINERIKCLPWKDPEYGLFDSDCLCPNIAIEKFYCNGKNTNFDMYMGVLEQHIVPYYARLVRFGAISKEDFFKIICGDLTTRNSVKREYNNIVSIISRS